MKKLYFVFIFSLAALGLSAQHRESESIIDKLLWDDKMLNIMIDTRIDFQTDFSNSTLNNAVFRGQTLRLWLVGEIVPGIHYRFRHRFNKPQTPLIRDNYSSATDHAWLALDAGKDWTFTVGKQAVQLGTFEYDYNGADLYLPSLISGDFDMYATGVNVAYKFSGQIMNLQVTNSNVSQFASEEYKNKAFAMNFLWQGNLFDGIWKTRWGYGLFQHSKTKFYNWITVGNQLNIQRLIVELDYLIGNRNMDYGSIVNEELGSRYVQDQSVSLNLKYNLGKWRPAVKGTWNQRYDKNWKENAYESAGLQAALEFYPFTHPLTKDLRFHIAYTYSHIDFQGKFAEQKNANNHVILAGTRWLFKVK
ncbi:MAG: OprO/OprP family phosphate-selective porin [Bacteroidales bacterium]|nr:OprO/OprP family phosphate-selective porin [Bacteroidales bacterium]